MSSKWYDLGLELNIFPSSLDNIQKSFMDNNDCLREAIKIYLKQLGSTWEKIVAALRAPSIKNDQLAEDIEKKHCKKTISNDDTDDIDFKGKFSIIYV